MVIQRWQSLLLFVAAVMMGCFAFMPIAQINTTDLTYCFTSMGFSIEGESTSGIQQGLIGLTWYFFALSVMSVILPLISIFLFKNLRLQRRMCLISVLFIIADLATGITLATNTFDNADISWESIVISPIIALAAVILAYWRIGKDRNKLLAADRIR